jgi:hypothetical protein
LGQVLAVAAAGVGIVRPNVERVLGCKHPMVALVRDQLADDALAGSVGVEVCGVDEIASGLGVCLEDAGALDLAPQPQSSPKVIAPRQSSESRRPARPKSCSA